MNCCVRVMSNTTVGILVGTSVAAGLAAYAVIQRNQNRSLRSRARKQALLLRQQDARLSESATDFLENSRDEVERQQKGVFQAIEAGKAAYQRVAG